MTARADAPIPITLQATCHSHGQEYHQHPYDTTRYKAPDGDLIEDDHMHGGSLAVPAVRCVRTGFHYHPLVVEASKRFSRSKTRSGATFDEPALARGFSTDMRSG